MVGAAARRRVAALRQPGPAARLARALWIAWAIVVWNVGVRSRDRRRGRSYVTAAYRAAAADPSSRPLNMDDWMEPAVTRAFLASDRRGRAILLAAWWRSTGRRA